MNQSDHRCGRQEIGGIVPEVSLPSVDGETRNLDSFLEGKKGAVVIFWSETCTHCFRYDAYLNGLIEKHPELGLVAIACRQGETRAAIRRAVCERNLQFSILHDSDCAVAQQWFAQQTPRAFLIDPARRLLYRGAIDNFKYPGDPDYQPYLDPAIESFLAGKPIERAETPSFGCAVQSVYYLLPKLLS